MFFGFVLSTIFVLQLLYFCCTFCGPPDPSRSISFLFYHTLSPLSSLILSEAENWRWTQNSGDEALSRWDKVETKTRESELKGVGGMTKSEGMRLKKKKTEANQHRIILLQGDRMRKDESFRKGLEKKLKSGGKRRKWQWKKMTTPDRHESERIKVLFR